MVRKGGRHGKEKYIDMNKKRINEKEEEKGEQ